ncbi:DUF945 family protein [Pseudomonas putida]|uniref:DUF945 family protein n=1 Tax=Pseudomonas putida TaxID=303 RepID=UPI0009528AC7|nr:DUF945 family protein [Pseudomonas putida]
MKKILIALGVLVSLGVLAAWYTGKMLPQRLDAVLVQVNQQLKVALGFEGKARIELLSLDARTFGADARYRLTLEQRDPDELACDAA